MVVTTTGALTAPHQPPATVDDVQRAASHAVVVEDPRVESVLVFGSVARGEATGESDVDVIVVVSDHVSDNDRWLLDSALSNHFDGVGCPVDLMLRRRSEFDHMVNVVTASVEHYVMGDAVCVYETNDRAAPSGNIGLMPRNNLAVALNDAATMVDVLASLTARINQISRDEAETEADVRAVGGSQAEINQATAQDRTGRYKSMLQDAHMVIEQALRATTAAVDNESLGKGHDLHKLLPRMADTAEKQALTEVLDPLFDSDGETKTWRVVDYTDHVDEWIREITAENTLKHVTAATRCGWLVLSTLEQHASNEPRYQNVANRLSRRLGKLEPLAQTVTDIETGTEPEPAPEPAPELLDVATQPTSSRLQRWLERRQRRRRNRAGRFKPKTGRLCGARTAKGGSCQHRITAGVECPAGHKPV